MMTCHLHPIQAAFKDIFVLLVCLLFLCFFQVDLQIGSHPEFCKKENRATEAKELLAGMMVTKVCAK